MIDEQKIAIQYTNDTKLKFVLFKDLNIAICEETSSHGGLLYDCINHQSLGYYYNPEDENNKKYFKSFLYSFGTYDKFKDERRLFLLLLVNQCNNLYTKEAMELIDLFNKSINILVKDVPIQHIKDMVYTYRLACLIIDQIHKTNEISGFPSDHLDLLDDQFINYLNLF